MSAIENSFRAKIEAEDARGYNNALHGRAFVYPTDPQMIPVYIAGFKRGVAVLKKQEVENEALR